MSLIKSYKTLTAYRKDPLQFIVNLQKAEGHRMHLRIFGRELFILSDPSDVVHVLKTNNNAYTKGRTTKALRQFLGSGLITNEGDPWRKQHRMIRPIMNLKSVFELAPKILATTTEFLPELAAKERVNSFKEMNRLTWRIILKTLFSQESTPEMDLWLEDILKLMNIITHKTRSTIPLPFWIPTPQHLEMKRIIRNFDDYVFGLIKQRRNGTKTHDLLQLLIDAQEEGLSQMTDREIRDEIMTFLMAGHETITNTMSWLLIELAQNPQYFTRLRDEADIFFKTNNFEELNAQPWHNAVIDEVMRLWPSVWVFMRQAEEDDRVGELSIPRGANVVVSPFLSHRADDLWTEPLAFKPERFLPEEKKKIKPGAFYPYGLGARACIGSYFAGMEAKIILASVIHHFDWTCTKLEKQESEAGITLRPINNVWMNFRRRS